MLIIRKGSQDIRGFVADASNTDSIPCVRGNCVIRSQSNVGEQPRMQGCSCTPTGNDLGLDQSCSGKSLGWCEAFSDLFS